MFSVTKEQLEATVDAAGRPFSGVVACRSGDADPVVVSRGLAYRPFAVPNSADTRFAVASGVKGFTAVAVLSLVDAGKLTLDTRVADVLSGVFPRFAPEVTVLHLLTHTSGIPDYCDEEDGCDFEALWVDRPVYRMRQASDFVPMFADLPMKFEPGERFGYNNSGFLVLGLIVEAVTSMPFARYVEEQICRRAGLVDTGFFESDALPDRVATGYIEDSDGSIRSNIFAIPIVGGADGGIITTAADVVRFWDGVFAGELASTETVALLNETSVGPTGLGDLEYSLGFWRANRWRDEPVFVLMGEDPGVSFYSAYSPATRDAFVVLSNSDYGAYQVDHRLVELFSATSSSQ